MISKIKLRQLKKFYNRFCTYLVLILFSLSFVFPIFSLIVNSFMETEEIAVQYPFLTASAVFNENNQEYMSIKLIPDMITVNQYINILLRQSYFLRMFWNSVGIVTAIIIGQLLISSMTAYAFTFFSFKGKNKLFLLYIITMLMPFQVTLIPNYLVIDRLGLMNKYSALILPAIFAPFGVFLLRQFMNYIPLECTEAAKIDGAGHFTIFFKIVLPVLKPAIASLIILLFIDYWNMIEQPLIFINTPERRPLSTYLSVIGSKNINYAFAASVIYLLPALFIFLYWEYHLIEGVQLSSIK